MAYLMAFLAMMGAMAGAGSSSKGAAVTNLSDDLDTDHGGHTDDDTNTDGDGHTGDDTNTDDGGHTDEGTDTDHGGHTGDDTSTDDGGHTGDDTGTDEGGHTGDDTGTDDGGHTGDDTGTDDGDDTNTDHGGHTDDGGHTGHDPAITPPSDTATQAEIDAYVAAVKAAPETHVHDAGSDKAAEHGAAMDLTPRAEATNVAVSDGDWFDPTTWYNGEIPADDAKVLIPEGISVEYSGSSDASLFTVRIDGELSFATDIDSEIVFDTMIVSPSGTLEIGSESNPVEPGVQVDLIIADNGPIDVDWDPMLLSRGLISHGSTHIYGAEKDAHEKVLDDPMEGDTSVTFDALPDGWQVGDKIVVAGTKFDGYKWDDDLRETRLFENQDETREITSIEGNTVYFDEPLEYDHDGARDDLQTSVANYSRNVTIETENADDVDISARGHVMFMHSDDVDVRYAEFFELGRTDKSELSKPVSDFDEIEADSNVQGRYSLHLHRSGVDDLENPVNIVGNAVWGSPGWGIVHHDSNADIVGNATYNTHGAGYVAETGNETGSWIDNIAIYAPGEGWDAAKIHNPIGDDVFDMGRTGDGFWFQGRMVESDGNIAASVNHGFTYFHRDGNDTMIDFDPDVFAYPDVFLGQDLVNPEDSPILSFTNNEVFAARQGLHVVKAIGNQGHDVGTHIDGFTAWNVQDGIYLEYTTHYLLTDIDVVAKEPTDNSPAGTGIELSKGAGDIVIRDSVIDGFTNGIDFGSTFDTDTVADEDKNFSILDVDITNTDTDYLNFRDILGEIGSADDLQGFNADLQLDEMLYDGGEMIVSGTKFDGLGTTDFPSGADTISISQSQAINMLRENGYWETSDGDYYFTMDVYFSDRLTGEVFYETTDVAISDASEAQFGVPWWGYEDIENHGIQDITTNADGETWAGDMQLDVAIRAVPFADYVSGQDLMHALTDGHGSYSDDMPDMADDIDDHEDHMMM